MGNYCLRMIRVVCSRMHYALVDTFIIGMPCANEMIDGIGLRDWWLEIVWASMLEMVIT